MAAAAKVAADAREIFLGKYLSLHLLGEGGMGQVYYGRDLKTRQEVVIKVMHDHLAEVPAIRQSFERELQLMMRFHHAHSVQLIDGSLDGPGRPCLVMEFIDGIDLEHHIEKHGRFPLRQVGWWIGQLCSVLYAAHQSNILHRDLTLNNLMLMGADTDDEILKVMDFGLARLTTAYFIPFEKLTGTGTNIGGGTPDYVAPEQVRGEQVDHRADLYSVGVILYKLLTGWLPFQEYTDVNQILEAHKSKTPPTFAERGVTDIPAEVEAIVRLLLSKVPSERPTSAKDLGLRFEKALHERIFPEGSWEFEVITQAAAPPRYDQKYCLDTMEAFMPEQIAIMKLRAFADSVGGEIAESEPGRIRIRLFDPRRLPAASEGGSGIFNLFRRKTLPHPQHFLHLDLFMEKHDNGSRSTVEIAVVMAPEKLDTHEEAEMRSGFGQRICRELRAYLMIGR
jgi:serine/threonine protein kinase